MVRWFWRQRETHRLVPRLHSVGPERDGAMNGLPSVQRALGSRERERERERERAMPMKNTPAITGLCLEFSFQTFHKVNGFSSEVCSFLFDLQMS